MTPEEFLKIINDLPDEERAAYKNDLLLYGCGYVQMTPDGRYRRIAPTDIDENPPQGGQRRST